MEMMLLAVVGAAILAGALYDAATLTIPNWISIALAALFPALALGAGLTTAEIAMHLVVGFAALVVGIGLFAAGAIGGGDAKLFAAVALYMGTGWVASYLLAVAVAGGLLACVVLVLRRIGRGGLLSHVSWLAHLTNPKLGIPYGVAIAAGGLFVLPTTQLYAQAIGGS